MYPTYGAHHHHQDHDNRMHEMCDTGYRLDDEIDIDITVSRSHHLYEWIGLR